MCRMQRSRAMTSATIPSIFSVDFSLSGLMLPAGSRLTTAFPDIHRSTAAKIYNIRPEDVTPRLRSSAKAINFGIMYGKGAYSLSKDIGVSVKEAEAFLQTYLATFPNIDGYMEKTIADARQCGYVSTLFGRRRALPELNSNNHNIRASGERMARNTPIQGTAADVIKLAMVRVWRRLRDEKMESRLILTVHDELIVEAPEAEVAEGEGGKENDEAEEIVMAKETDLPRILEIYDIAKAYMRASGNPNQWNGAYPDQDTLRTDIEKQQLYVYKKDGHIHGVFMLLLEEEPTYAYIEDGSWREERPYGTIHRLAGDGEVRGLFAKCVAFCESKMKYLRADTHFDNHTMQHLLEKNGFERRGIIYLKNGDPRIAYQK